jgi:hypothetical protein
MDRRTFAGKAIGVMGTALLAPLAARAETQVDAKAQEQKQKTKVQESHLKSHDKPGMADAAKGQQEQAAKSPGNDKAMEQSRKAPGGDKAQEESQKAPGGARNAEQEGKGGNKSQESAAKGPGLDKSMEESKKAPAGPGANSLPAKSGMYAPDEAERKRRLALQHLAARRLG